MARMWRTCTIWLSIIFLISNWAAAQQQLKRCSDGTTSYLKCNPNNPQPCDQNQRCECDSGGVIITGTGSSSTIGRPGYLEDRCFCCGGARGGVITPGGGFVSGGINNNFGSAVLCPDGSTRVNTCLNDGGCVGNYICVRGGPQLGNTQGSCCPSCDSVRNTQNPTIIGRFVPNCLGRYYAPDQSHPSTGYTWCVSQYGIEIPGTRRSRGQPRTVPCQLERQRFEQASGNFINSGSFGGSKRGQCPNTNLGYNSGLVQPCTNDLQCPSVQKCCYLNGQQQCVNPINGGIGQITIFGGTSQQCIQKPGQCGTILVGAPGQQGQSCTQGCDSSCPGTQKCCYSSQGLYRCREARFINGQGSGSNLIGGINSGSCFSTKPGQCPLSQVNVLTGNQRCSCDTNCPGNYKCCNGVCTSPYGSNSATSQFCTITKGGICPFISNSGSIGVTSSQCFCDNQCPGNQKCCSTSYGKQCTSVGTSFGGTVVGGLTNCGFTRPGICPNPTGINNFGQSIRQCNCDGDCSNSQQKCCADGRGGTQCTYPSGNSFGGSGSFRTKPGYCPLPPLQPGIGLTSRDQCQYDDQCQLNLKCCRMLNGLECVAPRGGSGIGQSQQCYDVLNRKEYRSCGTACPQGCDTRNILQTCTSNCVSGCYCRSPYIFRLARDGNWRNSDCVLPQECPGNSGIIGGINVFGQRQGTCPNITPINSSQQTGQVCSQDNDCPTDQKCCQDLRLGVNRNQPNRCTCPDPNSSWNACGSSCEPTCGPRQNFNQCQQCVQGCFCNSGFVRQYDSKTARCILQNQCNALG